MVTVLLSGTLATEPKLRQASTGADYVTLRMRVPCEGADAVFASLIAFDSAVIPTLASLSKGDPLAVVGRAKPKMWLRDGEEQYGLDVMVDQALSIYQAEKRRRRARDEAEQADRMAA